MIEPEDDVGSDADGGREGGAAFVVASVNATPVFVPDEHFLDLVPLTNVMTLAWVT